MPRFATLACLLGLVCVSCDTAPVSEVEPPPTPVGPERVSSAITVYNAGRALVKDTRRFDLDAGSNNIRFDEVTSGIVPASVHVEAADGTPVAVVEQNFEYDLVSTQRLLQRYLGEHVKVTTEEGQVFSGDLLSGGADVILGTEEGGVVALRGDQIRDLEFPELPEGLASRPSLVWDLEAADGGQRDLTVTYLSGGFTWSADYIVELSDDDSAVDVSGWVTVDNTTEASFSDTSLKLVAGGVNIISTPVAQAEALGYLMADASVGYGGGGGSRRQPVQREFFDYHLYEIPDPVDLDAHQTKQVEFVSVAEVPADIGYDLRFDGYWYGTTVTRHPTVTVELINGEEQKMGMPLPEGTVRVYKDDIDGASELVGESRIQHTPKNETVELTVGEAFDIVGEWKQTNHRVISDWVETFTYEAVVRNHKAEAVAVTVDHVPYHWSEWKVLRSSVDATRPDNATARFELEIPAEGETTLTYTIRTKW